MRSLIKRVIDLKDAIIEIIEDMLSLSISANRSFKDFKLVEITNAKNQVFLKIRIKLSKLLALSLAKVIYLF